MLQCVLLYAYRGVCATGVTLIEHAAIWQPWLEQATTLLPSHSFRLRTLYRVWRMLYIFAVLQTVEPTEQHPFTRFVALSSCHEYRALLDPPVFILTFRELRTMI